MKGANSSAVSAKINKSGRIGLTYFFLEISTPFLNPLHYITSFALCNLKDKFKFYHGALMQLPQVGGC